MNDDPEKPVTLGLARDRFLDSINNAPGDDDIDPEDAAEEFAAQQEELAETQKQEQVNRALGLTDDEREDLYAKFRDRQIVINVCNVVVAVAFFFGVRFGFEAINHRLAGQALPGQIQLFPDPYIWFFFAGFGALTLPWEITLQIWQIFAGRRTVSLYRQYQKGASFDYKGATYKNELGLYRWFILLIALPIGVANSLALNMHATLGPDAIRTCGYAFKPCKILPYRNIAGISYIPSDRSIKPPHAAWLEIVFKDGTRWRSTEWGDENVDFDPALVRFLAARIPLPIAGIENLQDVTLPSPHAPPQ
jgi:hypothetical protein